MAVMIYIAGLSGNATDKRYKHWTSASNVSFKPDPWKVAGAGAGGMAPTDRSKAEFVVTMDHGAMTVSLMQTLNQGGHFQYVRIHFLGTDNAPYAKWHFHEVFPASVQPWGYDGTGQSGVDVVFVSGLWRHET